MNHQKIMSENERDYWLKYLAKINLNNTEENKRI